MDAMDLMNQDIGDLVEEITSSDHGMRGLSDSMDDSEDEDEDGEMETHDDGMVVYEEEEEDGEDGE